MRNTSRLRRVYSHCLSFFRFNRSSNHPHFDSGCNCNKSPSKPRFDVSVFQINAGLNISSPQLDSLRTHVVVQCHDEDSRYHSIAQRALDIIGYSRYKEKSCSTSEMPVTKDIYYYQRRTNVWDLENISALRQFPRDKDSRDMRLLFTKHVSEQPNLSSQGRWPEQPTCLAKHKVLALR